MKLLFLVLILLIGVHTGLEKDILDNRSSKDYPIYKNGDCVQHKFAPEIKYAISGKVGSHYSLVVWFSISENDLRGFPRSAVSGTPPSTSEQYVGKFFEKVECSPHPIAFKMTVYEDGYDYNSYERKFNSKYF